MKDDLDNVREYLRIALQRSSELNPARVSTKEFYFIREDIEDALDGAMEALETGIEKRIKASVYSTIIISTITSFCLFSLFSFLIAP